MNLLSKLFVLAAMAVAVRVEAVAPWSLDQFSSVPQIHPVTEIAADGVKAIYFEGPPYRGKPTKVFAYYGIPAGASDERKVPGIVLVHGGGGTAYVDWVRLWVSRGYAAIAFDHFGNIPVKVNNGWQRNPNGGPSAVFGDALNKPPGGQWMYHAVADTMLANSLLRSLPGVDGQRIGLTGISWGGVVASTVSGLDTRFKFVVPVYGCGFISDVANDGSQFVGGKLPEEERAKWRELWDPANYLVNSRVPMLWVAGTNDFAFTLKVLQQSVHKAKGPQTFCLRLRMAHGHNGPGESPEEIRAFADSLVNGGKPLAKITATGTDGPNAWAEYDSPSLVTTAELLYTRYTGVWQNRKWETMPAVLGGNGRVSAELPHGTKAWFFNLTDERGLIISSDPVLSAAKNPAAPMINSSTPTQLGSGGAATLNPH